MLLKAKKRKKEEETKKCKQKFEFVKEGGVEEIADFDGRHAPTIHAYVGYLDLPFNILTYNK